MAPSGGHSHIGKSPPRLGVRLGACAAKTGQMCEASCLIEVAYALHNLGKYAEAIDLNERAATIFRATGSDYSLGFAYTEMGDSKTPGAARPRRSSWWRHEVVVLRRQVAEARMIVI
jgi:hypothetical protein